MVNETHEKTDSQSDLLGQIIRAAGHREQPPEEEYLRVWEATENAWKRKVSDKQRRRWLSTGLAASLAASIAVIVVLNTRGPSIPVLEPIAVIHKSIGTVSVSSATGGGATLVTSDQFHISNGARIETNDNSFAGLILDNGLSLRINEQTQVVVDTSQHISLLSGSVYVDTGATGDSSTQQIEIATPIGFARDIGTQFEVHYLNEDLRVRVREGKVIVRQGESQFTSAHGDQVQLDADGNLITSRIAPDDAAWGWTQRVAPHPQIDEQPVRLLLNWVARETGKRIVFEEPFLEVKASETLLHGSVRNLPPLEALDVHLATTDLDYVLLEESVIMIRLRNDISSSSSDN